MGTRIGCPSIRVSWGWRQGLQLESQHRQTVREAATGKAWEMQELSMNGIEQVNNGFVVVVAQALFDVGVVAGDTFQLKKIND